MGLLRAGEKNQPCSPKRGKRPELDPKTKSKGKGCVCPKLIVSMTFIDVPRCAKNSFFRLSPTLVRGSRSRKFREDHSHQCTT